VLILSLSSALGVNSAESLQSLYIANPQLLEDIKEQDILSIRTSTNAIDLVSILNC
jgi:hypothetical protein